MHHAMLILRKPNKLIMNKLIQDSSVHLNEKNLEFELLQSVILSN